MNSETRPLRVLVTGFPPFPGRDVNPTQALLAELKSQSLPQGVDLMAELLPCEYCGVETALDRCLASFQPDVILSFGVGRHRDVLRLESRGVNLDHASIPDNAGERREGIPIREHGASELRSRIPIDSLALYLSKSGVRVETSEDAGAYVCNHLIYHAETRAQELANPFHFVFTHLPAIEQGFDIHQALRGVELMIEWFARSQRTSLGLRVVVESAFPGNVCEVRRMNSSSTRKYWLGFDLGGTKMLTQIYDSTWTVVAKERKRHKTGAGAKVGVDRIVSVIRDVLEKADLTAGDLHGIGIGCPGPIDMENGVLLDLPNLGWETVPIRDRLEGEFNRPVAVLNDVDAGVYAEYRVGAAKGTRCAIGVFAGTGIGGGCVYQGEILRGRISSAFEIGHLQVMSNGPRCGCGQRGCLESVASRLAIAAQSARAAYRGDAPHLLDEAGTDIAKIRSGSLRASINAGDDIVEDVLREAARYIGIAVAGAVNLLCPDVVVLGGGLVEAMPEIFVSRVERSANKRVMPAFENTFKVVPASLEDDAGVLGAALWAEHVLGLSIEDVPQQTSPASKT